MKKKDEMQQKAKGEGLKAISAQLGAVRYAALVAQAARAGFTEETLLAAAENRAGPLSPDALPDEIARSSAHHVVHFVILAGSSAGPEEQAFADAAKLGRDAYLALLAERRAADLPTEAPIPTDPPAAAE